MCGIVGYVGKRDAADVLMDGLSKLEYRGYDSAGIAVFENEMIKVAKSKGRLADLKEKMEKEGKPVGHAGIGHTRWATHGEPSDRNSHPHGGGNVTLGGLQFIHRRRPPCTSHAHRSAWPFRLC